jgi:3-phenylpropionate/trans-cinnamate dioxygenase ferredoxin reductase subunit
LTNSSESPIVIWNSSEDKALSDAPAAAGPNLARGIPIADLAEGAMLEGHVGDEAVLLVRTDGRFHAIGARCTHYGGPLAEGLVVGGTIRCPWHHAAFRLEDGGLDRPPALSGLSCWQVEQRGDRVVVTGRADRKKEPPTSCAPGKGPESVVIVGGGAAGLMAADWLRMSGYDRPITMMEAGPHGPYDRPNLSKDYLAGDAPEEWIPLRAPEHYGDQGIDLLLDAYAGDIDVQGKRVRLSDGRERSFGALLIATGAKPIRLPLEPEQPVRYLRSLDDSRALIRAAESAKRAVVIGASFIGLEVAASLRARKVPVTVVAPDAVPLGRVLGPELGAFIRELHEAEGVEFRLGRTVKAVRRDGVTLDDGGRLPADLVVAGIGVRPRTSLAELADIAVDRGILVDEFLETSVPGIYAAGDVARWPEPVTGRPVRIEHWVVAERQGQAAAANILAGASGERTRFDAVPFFWSRHYDVTIGYTGHADGWDAIDVSGDIRARDCALTYRQAGRAAAVATIGRDRQNLEAEAAMEQERMRGEAVAR